MLIFLRFVKSTEVHEPKSAKSNNEKRVIIIFKAYFPIKGSVGENRESYPLVGHAELTSEHKRGVPVTTGDADAVQERV